jgi:hypoxanthine phosphoribosyltransferase
MDSDLERVVISEQSLAARVGEMAREIAACYPDAERGVTIVAVLSGSIIFLSDLIRCLPMKLRMDVVSVSSYAGATTVSKEARLIADRDLDVAGRDVLIVDDILDTGKTLRLVQGEVARRGANSVRTAVLLRKPSKAPVDVAADFVGFDIEDRFVVGYGLDYDGHYRNLRYIGLLKPAMYEQPAEATRA